MPGKNKFHTREYNYNIECRYYWLSNISLLYDLSVFNCNDVIIFISVCVKDLRNQLYDSYYLNFISAISRSKLEDIASAALAANAVNQVTKVILVILNKCGMNDETNILYHIQITIHGIFFKFCNLITSKK